jgi:hypothetical protein
MEVRKQFQIELSKRFAGLENLNDSEDINRAWEIIKEKIKIAAKETLRSVWMHGVECTCG